MAMAFEDSPTESMGALATVRQSLHPWLGYEVNYSLYPFQREVFHHSLWRAEQRARGFRGLFVAGPTLPILGLQPFGTVGVGALIFLPTTVGGQKYNQQTRVPLLYEWVSTIPILTSHLGLRFQYRGLGLYKTPDFNAPLVTTNARRQTSELSLGAYLRF